VISKTARDRPESFFYFNNGVSAICTDFDIDVSNKLIAKNFQVINGAQTITTLHRTPANPEIEVLFRLTVTGSVRTEKGFTRDIIQYNNSQNVIKVSDFRSNDEIQLWLEKRFDELRPRGPLPPLHYVRKRSVGRKGSGQGLRLEDLAKVRYSFLYEPTMVHASPRALWSPKEEGGVYEKTFGVEGEIQPLWSESIFDELLLAISFYLKLEEKSRELSKISPDLKFLRRLRFHALSLAGIYYREIIGEDNALTLIKDRSEFEKRWEVFWSKASTVLEDSFSRLEQENATMFAFIRSEERWQHMAKSFKRRLAL
jgi:hypothetical protein